MDRGMISVISGDPDEGRDRRKDTGDKDKGLIWST